MHQLPLVALIVHAGLVVLGEVLTVCVILSPLQEEEGTSAGTAASNFMGDLRRLVTLPPDVYPNPLFGGDPPFAQWALPVSVLRTVCRYLFGSHSTVRLFSCRAMGLLPVTRLSCLALQTAVPMLLLSALVRAFSRDGVENLPLSDDLWVVVSVLLTVLSSLCVRVWFVSGLFEFSQRTAQRKKHVGCRSSRSTDFPVESAVILEPPRAEAGPLVRNLHLRRALGRVVRHMDPRQGSDEPRLVARFAGARVTLPVSCFRLVTDSSEGVSGGAAELYEEIESRPTTSQKQPKGRKSRVSVFEPGRPQSRDKPWVSAGGFLSTGFASGDGGPERRASGGSDVMMRVPTDPADAVKEEVAASPWLPTRFDVDKLVPVDLSEEGVLSAAWSEVQCRRVVVGLSLVMAWELKEKGLVLAPMAESATVPPFAERSTAQLDRGRKLVETDVTSPRDLQPAGRMTVKLLLDNLYLTETRRPLWRLATEAVMLMEYPLAAALFALDLSCANPDAFLALFHRCPPNDLLGGLAAYTELRHVGVDWARFYAERQWAVATDADFWRTWYEHAAGPGDLQLILRAPPQPAEAPRPDYLTKSQLKERQKVELQNELASTALNLDKFGAVELSEYSVQWADGVDAVLDGEYVRASHVFMAADHPNLGELHDTGVGGNILQSLEYGRMVARHYALHFAELGLLEVTPERYAAEYLAQEDKPPEVPCHRLYARKLMQAHPGEGWTPCNRFLSEMNFRLLPGTQAARHVRSPLLGSGGPALDFPSFLLARPGALRFGSGSKMCPFQGLRSGVEQVRAGQYLCLWEGIHPVTDVRFISATSHMPLYIVPRGYAEAEARHYVHGLGTGAAVDVAVAAATDAGSAALLFPPTNLYDRVVFGASRKPAHNDLLHLVQCSHLRIAGMHFDHSQDGVGLHLTKAVDIQDCHFARVSQRPIDGSCHWQQEAEWIFSRHAQPPPRGSVHLRSLWRGIAAVVVAVCVQWVSPEDDSEKAFVLRLWLVAVGVDVVVAQTVLAVLSGLVRHAAEHFSLRPQPLACEVPPHERYKLKKHSHRPDRDNKRDLGLGWRVPAGAGVTDSDASRPKKQLQDSKYAAAAFSGATTEASSDS